MKPIPPNRDWQIPFLRILSDEKPHTRGEIIRKIAEQMDLTEEQLQSRFSPKGHRIVVNRVAWCDVLYCKAGFAIKDKASKDNMQHVFRITKLGLEEFQKNRHLINSAYIQSFWS